MPYAPYGVTKDAIEKDAKKRELIRIKEYLLSDPEETEYEGMTLAEVEKKIRTMEDLVGKNELMQRLFQNIIQEIEMQNLILGL